MKPSPDPGNRGAQKRQRRYPLRRSQTHLDGYPPAERIADHVGSGDLELVQHREHDLREPACVIGTECRLARGAESRQVGSVDSVARAERRRCLEQRSASAAEPVEQEHVRPLPHRQGRDAVPANRDVMDL